MGQSYPYTTPMATNTHSEYVTLIAFPLKQRLHERPQCYAICILPVRYVV